MIDGWRHADFRECVKEIRSGKSVNSIEEPANPDQIGVLKTSCVYNGRFDPRENKVVVPEEHSLVKCPVTAGTIIVSRMNTADLVGASGYVDQDYPNIFLPDRLWAIFPKHGVDPVWLYYVTSSPEIRARLSDNASGTSASMKNISQDVFLSMPARIPPLPEQRKIAEILRTWDEAIEKLEALRAAKRDRLTGLTQQLIGRGGAFPQKWPLKPLSSIAARVRRQNGGGDHPVMTISAKSGFLMQSDKFARDMAGSSVERYTLLKEGEFAYNKGNSLTAPYGCVYRLDRPAALVPFVYFCFALEAGLDHGFYEHLFAAGALNHQLSRLINSGVRNDGLLNLSVEDFFSCRIPVPPLDEQSSIARTLSAAKQELTLLDDEIEVLTRQKRGLMQKLLTGEWRVAV